MLLTLRWLSRPKEKVVHSIEVKVLIIRCAIYLTTEPTVVIMWVLSAIMRMKALLTHVQHNCPFSTSAKGFLISSCNESYNSENRAESAHTIAIYIKLMGILSMLHSTYNTFQCQSINMASLCLCNCTNFITHLIIIKYVCFAWCWTPSIDSCSATISVHNTAKDIWFLLSVSLRHN